MPMAKFVHGDPLHVDYTPGTAVAAGDVVLVGDLPLVANRNIAANEFGALAAGGGVYDMVANAAVGEGEKVYWDVADEKVDPTNGGGANKVFGYVVPGSSAASDGDTVRVIHRPEAT